jgi:diguanylate cyclase (GGDEF)-like protein
MLSSAAHHTVLVVDDDPVTCAALQGDLTHAGFGVHVAHGADEAMNILRANHPTIVITDWLMPGTDGLELCRAIRQETVLGFAYVIMLTVNSDAPRLVEAFEVGVDDFLPKPFELGVLLARMRAAIRIVDTQAELARRNAELETANRRLQELASTDELTGLANRRAGLERLQEYWDAASRHHHPLSCALIDVDHFKQLNDTYGHSMGDHVLREVSAVFARGRRSSDVVCRYGGEEFLLVLPHETAEGAMLAAARCRELIESHHISLGALSLSVTVSIGVAQRTSAIENAAQLLRAADDALYAAKENGRNTVRLAA